jgi:hypothetical protein
VQECNCPQSVQRVVESEDGINFLEDRTDPPGNTAVIAQMEMKRNLILQTRLDMGDVIPSARSFTVTSGGTHLRKKV